MYDCSCYNKKCLEILELCKKFLLSSTALPSLREVADIILIGIIANKKMVL